MRFPAVATPDMGAPFEEVPQKEYLEAPLVRLPEAPRPPGDVASALEARLSCRAFSEREVELAKLACVLRFSYGTFGLVEFADTLYQERPVPSAGGLYPLEIYVLAVGVERLEPGIYHYHPTSHALEQVRARPLSRPYLATLFMGQPYAAAGAAIVVLTAVTERTLVKYGDRGYRYILFEAGHVAQNGQLASAAFGLATLSLGGFFDEEVAALLELEAEEEIPLYGFTIGYPLESQDRASARAPRL